MEKPQAPEKVQAVLSDEDFVQVDLRVGTLLEVWKHTQSENLYCQKIDIGQKQPRQIASGLQKFVPIEEMVGQVIVMANLKARKLAGFNSNGMVMCTSNADHSAVRILRLPEAVPNGTRVIAQGLQEKMPQQPPQPVMNPKKKIYEKCAQGFKTNQKGEACWNGRRLLVQGKVITSEMKQSKIS